MSHPVLSGDELAAAVLSGERPFASSRADIESFSNEPLAVAIHQVGEFAAVLLVLPREFSPDVDFDLDVAVAQFDTDSGWRILGTGGGTWGGRPIDLLQGQFWVGGSVGQDVSVDGRDMHLSATHGWAPGGSIVARAAGREFDRVESAAHGLWCFVACLPIGESAAFENV